MGRRPLASRPPPGQRAQARYPTGPGAMSGTPRPVCTSPLAQPQCWQQFQRPGSPPPSHPSPSLQPLSPLGLRPPPDPLGPPWVSPPLCSKLWEQTRRPFWFRGLLGVTRTTALTSPSPGPSGGSRSRSACVQPHRRGVTLSRAQSGCPEEPPTLRRRGLAAS